LRFFFLFCGSSYWEVLVCQTINCNALPVLLYSSFLVFLLVMVALGTLQARCLICTVALIGLSLFATLRVKFLFPNVKSERQGIVMIISLYLTYDLSTVISGGATWLPLRCSVLEGSTHAHTHISQSPSNVLFFRTPQLKKTFCKALYKTTLPRF